MVTVVQLAERPVVVREVAGSSPVSHPVVSHGVDGRVQENPELGPFGRVRGFLLLSCGKVPDNARIRSRLAPERDEAAHLSIDRAVGYLRFLARTIACTLWRSETAPPRARNKSRA